MELTLQWRTSNKITSDQCRHTFSNRQNVPLRCETLTYRVLLKLLHNSVPGINHATIQFYRSYQYYIKGKQEIFFKPCVLVYLQPFQMLEKAKAKIINKTLPGARLSL